jgi:hypothetical protein
MVAHGRGELQAETLALCITQGGHVLKVLFGFLGKGFHGLAQFKELMLGLAYQLHEDTTLASTASAKGTHDLLELLLEAPGLALQLGASVTALLGDVVDDL